MSHQGRYAIALHEIGHLVTSWNQPLLYREGAAWKWAKEHALLWSPRMQRAMENGLLTYLKRALLDYDCANLSPPVRLPPAKHFFWEGLQEVKFARELLELKMPGWLHDSHPAIPWRTILAHPTRPRCENCGFWQPLAESTASETPEKRMVGECVHQARPLGTEMTPGGAFCGSSWVRSEQ